MITSNLIIFIIVYSTINLLRLLVQWLDSLRIDLCCCKGRSYPMILNIIFYFFFYSSKIQEFTQWKMNRIKAFQRMESKLWGLENYPIDCTSYTKKRMRFIQLPKLHSLIKSHIVSVCPSINQILWYIRQSL